MKIEQLAPETPLDQLANSGLDVPHKGTYHTFRTLTYRQRAKLISMTRSFGLDAYLNSETAKNAPLQDTRRTSDINAIVFGTLAQDIDWQNPLIRQEAFRMSLTGDDGKAPDDELVTELMTSDDVAQYANVLINWIINGRPEEPNNGADPTRRGGAEPDAAPT